MVFFVPALRLFIVTRLCTRHASIQYTSPSQIIQVDLNCCLYFRTYKLFLIGVTQILFNASKKRSSSFSLKYSLNAQQDYLGSHCFQNTVSFILVNPTFRASGEMNPFLSYLFGCEKFHFLFRAQNTSHPLVTSSSSSAMCNPHVGVQLNISLVGV